jgi:bacillithiol system protein YtxJ
MATPYHSLTSTSDWEDALQASEDQAVLIFKHSSACSVSARADQELSTLADETDLPMYQVVVQEARPVSNEIEDELGVRHETPQAILLRNRRPVFHTSHFDVTADAIRDELSTTSASTD